MSPSASGFHPASRASPSKSIPNRPFYIMGEVTRGGQYDMLPA